jgi:hypothetical protein
MLFFSKLDLSDPPSGLMPRFADHFLPVQKGGHGLDPSAPATSKGHHRSQDRFDWKSGLSCWFVEAIACVARVKPTIKERSV